VAAYFLDSSALVKRYATETGTAWVTSLLDPASRNRLYVAQITGAEVVAALARKRRGLLISAVDAATALAQFRHDFASELHIIEVSAAIVSDAMRLAEAHYLRGYDAVQVAAAISANRRRVTRGAPALTMVSADTDVIAAGAAEGLATDDPNNY
jgi:predicted nucleic acid-binding protein